MDGAYLNSIQTETRVTVTPYSGLRFPPFQTAQAASAHPTWYSSSQTPSDPPCYPRTPSRLLPPEGASEVQDNQSLPHRSDTPAR